jgi:hypothetical protein
LQNLQSCDLPEPTPWENANKRLLLGAGSTITPLNRLSTFSPDDFERFVLEWAGEYLSSKYNQVQQRGGAGDKGRDVVAWIDPSGIPNRKWDNFQCKHYGGVLTASKFWVELGKLVYYTYTKQYTIPQNYFVVTTEGLHTTLLDYLENPEELKKKLIENWKGSCEKKISSGQVIPLKGDFEQYVRDFDFSIVKELSPLELIEGHSKTKYHDLVFGTKLRTRPKAPSPPAIMQQDESRYIEQIYEVFAEKLNIPITDPMHFESDDYLTKLFKHSRVCFYSAEALKEFARDNLPNKEVYTDLLDEFETALMVTVNKPYPNGLTRMEATLEKAPTIHIDSNVLRLDLEQKDRQGICHQLANEDRITWKQ